MESKLQTVLEAAWDLEGVLGRLRRRKLDLFALRTLGEKLAEVETANSIRKREVALLWYVPLFLAWQREHLEELNPKTELNEFDVISNGILTETERILGVP
ncbi:MAG: hypothetical protein K8R59_16705 [Thermoanaerobaculales bacterium]|nr:hypothetical protein [Thermoanaerobaculales bacterium]